MSLGRRVGTAVFWSSSSEITFRAVSFVATLVVVRMLTPTDYGLYAVAFSLRSILQSSLNFGGYGYLVREEGLDDSYYHTVWTINLLKNLIVSVVLTLGAPLLEHVTEIEGLSGAVWAIAAINFVQSFTSIGLADLERNLDYRRIFAVRFASAVAQALVAIGLALAFRNYWALVGSFAAMTLTQTVGSHFIARRSHRLSLSQWSTLKSFLINMLGGNLLINLSRWMDELVMSLFVPAASIGRYTLARDTANMPMENMVLPIAKVMLPSFAQARMEGHDLAVTYRKVLAMIKTFLLPVGFGLYVVAPLFVPLVLGDKWVSMIWILETIIVAKSLTLIFNIQQPILVALDETAIFKRRALVFFVLKASLMVAGYYAFGFAGMVYGVVTSLYLVLVADLWIAVRIVGCRLRDLGAAVARPFVSALVMVLAVAQYLHFVPTVSIVNMLMAVTTGALVYCAALLLMWSMAGKPRGPETKVFEILGSIRS